MREILFRGKRIDNGEWIEGYYFCSRNPHRESIHKIRPLDSDWSYEINPETVGQYTGLTDKNGKRIFEGDVIAIPGSRKPGLPGIVAYLTYESKYILFRNQYSYLNLINVHTWGFVIGNTHDSPELLEVRE